MDANGQIKYCTQCGSKNNASNKFCTTCGKEIIATVESVKVEPVEETFFEDVQTETNEDNNTIEVDEIGIEEQEEIPQREDKPAFSTIEDIPSESKQENEVPAFTAVADDVPEEFSSNETPAFAAVADEVSEDVSSNETPAFASVSDEPISEERKETKSIPSYVEPQNVFAQGLPSWDIVPPQVLVRRHK